MQSIFKRYELKYKLDKKQYDDLCAYMADYMQLDSYKRHKITNIYFDTEDYKIIRHSLEKPKYKEKLRLRIYGEPKDEGMAFIELKKKFDGVVYKRRMALSQRNALDYLCEGQDIEETCQIQREIDYFKSSFEDIAAKVYLSYEREAYFCPEDENFRMTFDFNIKMRDKDVTLEESEEDNRVLDGESVLLEVKTVQGLPFWFIDFLNKNNLYKISFSKYGTAYNTFILPKFIDNLRRTTNA